MTEIRQPTDAEIAFVVDAALVWCDDLIPGTATATFPAVLQLITAVHRLRCQHPRDWWIFHPDGTRGCGMCGGPLPDDPTPQPAP